MSTQSLDILALTENLELFLKDPEANSKSLSAEARYRLSEAARKVSFSTEATGDTFHRIAHSVSPRQNDYYSPC